MRTLLDSGNSVGWTVAALALGWSVYSDAAHGDHLGRLSLGAQDAKGLENFDVHVVATSNAHSRETPKVRIWENQSREGALNASVLRSSFGIPMTGSVKWAVEDVDKEAARSYSVSPTHVPYRRSGAMWPNERGLEKPVLASVAFPHLPKISNGVWRIGSGEERVVSIESGIAPVIEKAQDYQLYIGPNAYRMLTIGEMRALLGFPREMKSAGTWTSQVHRMSNSVPPAIAKNALERIVWH